MLPRITKLMLEVVALSSIFAALALVGVHWAVLPESIPTHFNLYGQPDGFGPKYTALFLPALMLVLYVTLSVLAKYPSLSNKSSRTPEQNARYFQLTRSIMGWFKAELGVLFLYIQWSMIATATGAAIGLNPFVLFGILAVFWITFIVVYVRWRMNSDQQK